MKWWVGVCFLAGLLVSVTWTALGRQVDGQPHEGQQLKESSSSIRPTAKSSTVRARPSNEDVIEAILQYDGLEEGDFDIESRLKVFIFRLSGDEIEEVIARFSDLQHLDRFGEIAAAVYARWAELDPVAAWAGLGKESHFPKEARRGVLFTWLNSDSESALEALLQSKEPTDIALLESYSFQLAQHSPFRAAELVDSLFETWPEAEAKLFPETAKLWGQDDPESAAAWIASHWDRETRNGLLIRLTHKATSSQGRVGLQVADLIDDPNLRERARLSGIKFWGSTSGNQSVGSKVSDPDLDLRGGFPSDWSDSEIRIYSEGFVDNHSKLYPNLLEVAKNDEQRQLVYQGVVRGAREGQPSTLLPAFENISGSYLDTQDGRKGFKNFYSRWSELSPQDAENWLQAQPEGRKKQFLNNFVRSEEFQQNH
ncbi:MAG: hypothetical protein ACSHYB_05135 [Roseibacillus sp.]